MYNTKGRKNVTFIPPTSIVVSTSVYTTTHKVVLCVVDVLSTGMR